MKKINKIIIISCYISLIVLTALYMAVTFSDAKIIFGLARHGEETLATIVTSKSYVYRNREYYLVTAEFTDKYNKTYITNTIKTENSLKPGDKITIIYNKFSPQVADRKDNSLRKKKFNINLYICFIFIILTIQGYQEFKSSPNFWRSKRKYKHKL